MPTSTEAGRADLLAWQAKKPTNFFSSDANLGRVLELRLGRERLESERARLTAAGEMIGTELSRLAFDTNQDENLPRLERYSGLGERTESVVFHPSYHQAGRLVWQTGVLSDYAEPGNETVQMALLHLLAQPGEYGHNCPLACTAGLIKVVQKVGSESQKARWLPGLLSRDYDVRLHASQFLTEVQGGSDVGANAVVAKKDGDHHRIFGEKWFCSVIDARLFLLTARPEGAPDGTRGLGLFVVPREVDGRTNEFHVRRLKKKLGTRAMASGETDFAGALAEPVGALDRGFKHVVEHVLDTSRLFNAVSCAGSMTAAWREAATFARHRRAFGREIAGYPLVKEALATLRADAMGATAASLRLAAQADQIARGRGDDALAGAWRVGVNVNKYWTSVRNTQSVRTAIEVLGGNGTIDTFSPLPRLFRDTMVLESWEGAHNVLVEQVTRDAARYGLHERFMDELGEALARAPLAEHDAILRSRAERGLTALRDAFRRLAGGEGDQRFARRLLDQAGALLECVAMLEELAAAPEDAAKRGAVELIAGRFLADELRPPPELPVALLD